MNGHLQAFTKIDRPAGAQVMGMTVYRDLPPGTIPPAADRSHRERWENNEYKVAIDKLYPTGFAMLKVWEIAVQRRDGDPANDWRDLQAIKSTLVGPEFEALELYPAESRVMDVANETHLFVVLTEDEQPARIRVGREGAREVNDLMLGQRPL